MHLKPLEPRKAINKAFLKIKPNRTEIEKFKANLIELLDRTNDVESEEFHKNLVSDFLKRTYYESKHFINTKGRNDLVIHNGNKAKNTVGVILEAKKPTNRAEMVSRANLNVKAFQELVLYYLRERITHKNLEVKYLVVTNIYEWFIFDANVFERLFAQNKNLVKQFNDFENGRLAGKTTDFFYREIAEPFVKTTTQEIEFTYLDFRTYEKPLRNNNPQDDRKLIALFKLLSPEHLLKLPFANDSNSLDKRFYGELLHIIGLAETKEGSKKLIGRNKLEHRNAGSLLENAIIQLDSMDKINRLENPLHFGATQEERLFNVGLELVITWINRILFLKLLEAQLITYSKGDKSFEFLSIGKITDYNDLNSLFFRVLAKRQKERDEGVKNVFAKVPYLNSSLFEPTDIEHLTLFISNLDDDRSIPLYSGTILKSESGKKRTGALSTLEYFFEFLNAYDFSSEGSEEIQEENKTLINASVLGLIFEKINGYKDGSFFTPGFITMYMCRETIRKAVLQKFNETKGWECKDLDSLYDKIENRKEANQIVNSLKICDPAVGSGHFLVSALNEMIAIKNDLRILQDRDGRRLKEYHFEVVNDELIVTDEDGALFDYNPNNKESQRIQQALFHEKQTLIENCLFGVDINPNSVKICRLRLWIELLKNAYYNVVPSGSSEAGELETLPNIDINIKCGNSLISRFALDADLKKALRSSKWNIGSYRDAVATYRNAENKEQKHAMERLIADIKSDFRSEISLNDPKVKRLIKLKAELFGMTNQVQMFEMSKKEKTAWNKKLKEIVGKTTKLEAEIEDIKNNKIYEDAFEWRFEFPEVLSDAGDFVGFDVVIGNPPYGVSIKGLLRDYLIATISKVPDYEIYYWFIDRANQILKEQGTFSYIIPNTILFNVFAQKYRLELFDSWNIDEILDCTNFDVFSEATVRNIIIMLTKSCSNNGLITYRKTDKVKSFDKLISNKRVQVSKSDVEVNNQNWGLIFKLEKSVIELIKKVKSSNKLSDQYDATQGYIPYRKSDLIKSYGKEKAESIVKNREWHATSKINEDYKEEIWGESISKYGYKNTGSYVWYGKHLATYVDLKYFNQKRILIREITNPGIIASLVEEEFVNDPQIISIIQKDDYYSLEFLWAILNSKLATFYHFNSSPKATKGSFPKILVYDINNFPLPEQLSAKQINEIENLVFKILNNNRNDGEEYLEIETQIDHLVYQLYDLTEDEIAIIEAATS